MPLDELEYHDTPSDEYVEGKIDSVRIAWDTLLANENDIYDKASTGNYEEAFYATINCFDDMQAILTDMLHIIFRLWSVYPWGSNELTARVLERLNSPESINVPEPDERL